MIRNITDTKTELLEMIAILQNSKFLGTLYSCDKNFKVVKSDESYFNSTNPSPIYIYHDMNHLIFHEHHDGENVRKFLKSKLDLNALSVNNKTLFTNHPDLKDKMTNILAGTFKIDVEDDMKDFDTFVAESVETNNNIENALTKFIEEFIASYPTEIRKKLSENYNSFGGGLRRFFLTIRQGIETLSDSEINSIDVYLKEHYDEFINDIETAIKEGTELDFVDNNKHLSEICSSYDIIDILIIKGNKDYVILKEKLQPIFEKVRESLEGFDFDEDDYDED